MLYDAREKVTKLYYYYSSMMSKTKHKATKGEGLTILAPKQMLQRFPVSLAQVKARRIQNIYYAKSYKLLILFIIQNKLLKKI